MLKKISALALILLMVLSLGACKLMIVEKVVEEEEPPAESPYDGKPATEEYREEEPVVSMPVLSEDDPEYEQIMLTYRGAAPLGAYDIVYPGILEGGELEKDDFWLLMAMVAQGTAPAEYFDAVGNVDMPKEEIDEYAETFFGACYENNGVPSYEGSYAASSDPKGTVITLLAMSIDSYEPELVGFWRENEDDYVLVIDYRPKKAADEETQETNGDENEEPQADPDVSEDEEDDLRIRRVAYISRRTFEDDTQHYFAFKLTGIGEYTGFPGEEGEDSSQ